MSRRYMLLGGAVALLLLGCAAPDSRKSAYNKI